MPAPTITPLPPAPNPSQSESEFDAAAFARVNAETTMVAEINSLVDWLNANINVRTPITKSSASFNLDPAETGLYIRLTGVPPKTLTIQPDDILLQPNGAVFFIKNIGAGDLTITEGDGVTVNDNLVVTQGASVILQKIAADTYDLISIGGEFTADMASETGRGLTELATAAETIAGTSNELAVHPAGAKAAIDNSLLYRTRSVASIAALSALTGGLANREVTVIGFHANAPGFGGGRFVELSGSPTINNVSTFASATAGFYWQRLDPKRTPYEAGYRDGDVDVSVAINAVTNVYGACYLDKGKTYNVQYAIAALKLQCEGGVATLNATSPTGNGRFGSNNAVITSSGSAGTPLEGVDVRNIIINCNQLRYANNSTYIKGTIFYRLKNFYQRGCTVLNCGSYAFWDWDDVGGTTYCSGTRDDCWAIDAGVSFEQVNVRGVTLNNCHAYRSTATLAYQANVECQFHAYGGSDMQVVYNNCTGVADGYVPAIFLALLQCKNVTANDCQFINNAVLSGQVSAAVFFSNDNGNYDNFNFNNCILKSANSAAVYLDKGALGSANARFQFRSCKIDGETVGVQINGTGGIYYFLQCDTTGSTVGASAPWAYYNNATPTRIQITGGSATSVGSAATAASNISSTSFNGVSLTPAGTQLPRVRQKVVGMAQLSGDGSTYSQVIITLPSAMNGWVGVSSTSNTNKVSVVASIDADVSGATTYPQRVTKAKPYSVQCPANNQVRIIYENLGTGQYVRYEVTEYE